jgi:Arc/MetJ-type ribon-helix-helix transcriptional regulator
MQLILDSSLEALLNERMRKGGYATAEDALRAAFVALKQQEEFGNFAPGELDAALAESEKSIAEHGTVDADTVYANLERRSQQRRQNKT